MESKDPLDAVRSMMADNLEKVGECYKDLSRLDAKKHAYRAER